LSENDLTTVFLAQSTDPPIKNGAYVLRPFVKSGFLIGREVQVEGQFWQSKVKASLIITTNSNKNTTFAIVDFHLFFLDEKLENE